MVRLITKVQSTDGANTNRFFRAKTPVRHKAFVQWIHERLLIEERKLKFYGNIVSLFYKIAWNISFALAFVLNVMLLVQSEILDNDQLNYAVQILTIFGKISLILTN